MAQTADQPDWKEVTVMAIGDAQDKVKHAAEEAVGKGKEAVGNVTGNEDLQAEGQGDQASANMKQAGDKAADAARSAFGKD